MFDYIEYSRAIDEFLVKMEQKSHQINSDIQDALEGICHLLGIARVEAEFYENYIEEGRGSDDCVCFYQEGTINPECVYTQREVTANDYAAVSLINHLKKENPSFLNDLFIVGFANTHLGKINEPSITSVALNYEEYGRTAVAGYPWIFLS